jgi:glutamate---cysteine ligase / carboxylate-amine ligase
MKEDGFGRTPKYSFGIEEEFQLFNRDNLKPYPSRNLIDKDINHELLYNQIEIKTGVCKDVDQAKKDLGRLRGKIADKCRKNNVLCIASGTVPFLNEEDIRINPYYSFFLSEEVSRKKDYVFNATHVHVSMEKPNEAITVMHGGSYLSPELIALSANSPFLFGKNTGDESHRRKLWLDIGKRQLDFKQRIKANNVVEKYGIHEYFVPTGVDYDEYEKMINEFRVLGSWPIVVDSRPDKGTVHFRHFDQIPDLDVVISLASLARGLSYCLINEKKELYPYSTPELQSKIIQSSKYALKDAGIKDNCKNLLQTVSEESDITTKDELMPLVNILNHGTTAEKQIKLYNKGLKSFVEKFSIVS